MSNAISSISQSFVPVPIERQVEAIYESDNTANCIALVWPEELLEKEVTREIDGKPTRFVYCSSELAMREALVEYSDSPERLVLVSKFNEVQLAKDVLARVWKYSPQHISPWKNLQQFIKVKSIDPRLQRNGQWIAKALLARLERYQHDISFGEVLDLESAWRALALGYLDYREKTLDLQSIFSWSTSSDSATLVDQLPLELKDNLSDWLDQGLPNYSALVKTLMLDGQVDDLLSIGLACSVLFYQGLEQLPQVESVQLHLSRGRFSERYLAGHNYDRGLLHKFGNEAVLVTEQLLRERGYKPLNSVLGKAEQILASLDLMSLIDLSTILPNGLQRRITSYALTLKDVLAGKDVIIAEASLEEVKQHSLASFPAWREVIERAEMAIRLVRWIKLDKTSVSGSLEAIEEYIDHGCFADWARSVVWYGDANEMLSQVYHDITTRVTEERELQNQGFGKNIESITRGDEISERYIPVESVLERLIAPIAEESPVLLLVLDGMSLAVYRELSEDLLKHHWLEVQKSEMKRGTCLLSALPTVTQVSRFSLLSGSLGIGLAADEKKLFSGNSFLKKNARRYPPEVFHKQDLHQPKSNALNGSVRAKLANKDYRILATVINAIDDQLSSSSQVSFDWTVDSITLLSQVLEAAREAGRVIVITSDHGHVLDHDSFYQKSSSDNGERYQHGGGDCSDYEVEVSGDRVITEGKSVVLPWSERLRYTKSKSMGYHGGASLQEVVIPIGVFVSANDTESLVGWTEVPRYLPDWWFKKSDASGSATLSETGGAWDSPRKGKDTKQVKKAKAAAEFMDDMFSGFAENEDGETFKQGADWIDKLFESTVYQQIKNRAGRRAIQEDQLHALIQLLDKHQGQVMEATVLQHLSLPKIRLRGFLAGAQKLLNVDGYAILSVERESQTIRLNISDLKKQFEL